MIPPSEATQKFVDGSAIIATATAPVWATILAEINGILTAVSLLIGICFALWRWSIALARERRADRRREER